VERSGTQRNPLLRGFPWRGMLGFAFGFTQPTNYIPGAAMNGSQQRPGGIPLHWLAEPAKKGGGTKYLNPANPHDHARIMPGDPKSPHPAQRAPYVKRMRDGIAYDVSGRPVDPRSAEAHIPLREFRFKD
jgi:hypothetical protein